VGRRLGEATALQPFGEQAQAVTGGPEQFDLTAVTTAEDKDVTGHRVIFECSLDFCAQAIEAVAHVGDTGNQPDFCASGQRVYHERPPRIIACSMALSCSGEGLWSDISPPGRRITQSALMPSFGSGAGKGWTI